MRIITLKYCDGFCHTSIWIGHGYTCVPSILNSFPPPSPPYPSKFSQSTGFGCPVWCVELLLVTCFTYGNAKWMFQCYFLTFDQSQQLFHTLHKSFFALQLSFYLSWNNKISYAEMLFFFFLPFSILKWLHKNSLILISFLDTPW